MNLLHYIISPEIGGLENLIIKLAIKQNKKGLNAELMFNRGEGEYLDFIKKNNIKYYISDINGGYDVSIKKFLKIKKHFDSFDVVNIHSFSFLTLFAALKSKAKVVYTIHGLSKGMRVDGYLKTFF